MQRPNLLPLWIAFIVLYSKVIDGSTLLRTAVIPRGESPTELDWLGDSGQRRQLLGYNECKDSRWGLLRGRMQLLLQLQDGYTRQEADRLASQLHADGAVISTSLPDHTWLLLVLPEALKPDAYQPHTLVPYASDYKIAPEWHPVLEMVQQQQQQTQAAADAGHHLQVHKRIMSHAAVKHLKVADAAQHLRLAAAAAAADAATSSEIKHQAPSKVLIGLHFAEVSAADLQRLKVRQDQFHPAAAAASDWAQHLQAVVMDSDRSREHQQLCQPELVAVSPWELDVAVCPQDLSEVLYWLSNQAVVHWLAPRPRLYFSNVAASKIIQASTMKTALDYSTPDAKAFWTAGLDGRGQIVGMGDSGIDMQSCFFSDPQNPFVLPVGSKEWVNPQHRKVVYYYGLADEYFRDLVGHGTHTAGSVAGFNPNAPDSKATGAAKGARLAFTDLSRTAGGDVNAPPNLERDYFPRMYANGARIFSDSWGSGTPVYDGQASSLDSWLYNNQDCISHFAAGNFGENDNLDSTITSPATAKNTVTVGATKSAMSSYVSQTIAPVFMMSVEIKRKDKPLQYVGVRLVKADFGGDGASLSNKGLRVVRASPEQGCGALDGAAAGGYVNTILLVKRGSCYFSEKLKAGAAAGVAAVVIINDKPGGYFKMDAQEAGPPSAIPVFSLTRRTGRQLWSFFDTADSIAATIERYAQGWPAYEDIASFSSFGPTPDGRIKPDIVAPGELVSAASGDKDPSTENSETCSVERKAGTSMATPMTAGHTAIIRQYFMDGYYPTGAVGNAAYTPSGPLMKGVMLGGACDMQGNTEQYLPLEDSPSMRQGFGRFCLCNAVKLASNCSTNLQFADRVPIISQDTHKYCLQTTGGDVRITLSWYDPPAALSASKALVNDLDLTVVSAGMGGQSFFGNMELEKDSLNTVERVWLRNVPPGGLDITVSSAMLSPATKSQNYSLVVQGAFTGTLSSPFNPDPTAAKTLAACTPQAMQQQAGAAAAAAAPAQPAVAAAAVVEESGKSPPASTVPSSAVAAAAAISPATEPQPAAAAATAAPAVPPAVPPPVPPAVPPTAVEQALPTAAATPPSPDAAAAAAAAAAAQQAQHAAAAAQEAAAAQQAAAAAAAAQQAAATAAAAQQAAAAVAPAAAPAAAPVDAAAAAAPQPAVAQPTVAQPAPDQPPAEAVPLPQDPATNPASLVDALVVAMTASQPTTLQSVPAAAPAQGRRLTWAPAAVPAWIRDSNMSVAIKVPLMVCRWINATAKKAANAVSGEHPLAHISTGSSAARSLQAQATAGYGDAAAGTLLVPLQHLVLAGAMVLGCVVVFTVGVRRYQIYRSYSLTSAVCKDMSMNKAMGRAPTGEAALMQALMSDPSLIEQLSPTKRASLGLGELRSAGSPFEGGVSFSSGSTSSSSLHKSNSSGRSLSLSPAQSGQDSPDASPSDPYEPLRVRLARHSAKGGSMPVPYRPVSVPAGGLQPAGHSAPIPAMHSAPVSPVGTPVLAGGRRGVLGAPLAAAAADELRVVVSERPVRRVSDSMLPLPGSPFSPDMQYTRPRGLPRCSNSFTFGNTAEAAASMGEARDEVFGLAHAPTMPVPAAERPTVQQLRSKSAHGDAFGQSQQRDALLSHWRPLSPEYSAEAPTARPSLLPGDAGQQRDQRWS